MKNPGFTRLPLFPSLILLVAMAAGCAENTTPYDPAPGLGLQAEAAGSHATVAGKVGLDALWPNEDGRSWSYTVTRHAPRPGGTTYGPALSMDPLQVPAAPSPEEIVPYLRMEAHGSRPPLVEIPPGWTRDSGTYTLTFDGRATLPDGGTAQKLVESIVYSQPADGSWVFSTPLFLHGGAWEKTDSHIGSRSGEPGGGLAWEFLDADVRPGASFSFRLSPPGAGDVILHALVLPRNLQDKLGEYRREIEVAYVVDHGVRTWFDPTALFPLYWRPIDYGSVVYVPGVGPVRLLEHRGTATWTPQRLGGPGHITTRLEAHLQEVIPGAPAAAVAEP